MSDWKRTTKEVPFENLPSEIVSVIHQHINQYNLGSILADALMCIQTESEKAKKSLFANHEIVHMAAVVTPRWLVWSVDQPKERTAVLSAQLIHVTVQDYAQTPFAQMVPDSGVQVTGMFTDASESASAFIGLGEGTAGQRFRQILIKAAADAKK
jgi:hypothetical protein